MATNTALESAIAATTAPKSNVGAKIGTESALSNYVGPYVTEMLGRGQALGSMPYQAYQGPLTAGESTLQNQAFSGLAGLALPTEQMGAFTPTSFTETGTAQKFMNPYLQSALDPQITEARRQADIQRVQDASRLTKAGAYGGSRQAIVEAENNRALLDRLAGITGTGYANAFDKAMQQFNTEEDRRRVAQDMTNQYGLGALLKQADLGTLQRGIESEGIAADRDQFEEERDFPYKQVQYMQSLLQGLPLETQAYSYQQPGATSQLLSGAGGIMDLYGALFGGDNKSSQAERDEAAAIMGEEAE
jgi:hypothetical protein